MKKIIFIAQSLKVGGVERALVEQVNNLSKSADVTLFLFSKTGAYINEIDNRVKVIYGNYLLNCIGKTKNESKEHLLTYIVRNGIASIVKIMGRVPVYKFLFLSHPKISGYDVAISYVNDQGQYSLYSGCNQFLLSNIKSTKKIAWIHSDPSRLGLMNKNNIEIYKKMDYIVNVSHAMKLELDKLNIISTEKSVYVYNRLNENEIIRKSKESSPFVNNNLTLLTVGRLEELKGTKDLMHVAKRLAKINPNFTWYFLGDGVLRTFCETYIAENGLERNIILLGNKSNPYPYIANADICISGSQSETFGISIIESLLLKTPVVALRYSAIDEILNNSNGCVCNSYDEILNKIKNFVENESQLIKLKDNTALLMDYNKLNNIQISYILSK